MINNKHFSFFFALLLLASCKDFNTTNNSDKNTNNTEIKTVNSPQVLHLNEMELPKIIFPHTVVDLSTSNISNHVFEGLLKFNSKDLSLNPALAKEWKVDSTGKNYTFILRDNAYFQNDICFKNSKGRKITSQDLVYSFELLCSDNLFNQAFKSTFKDLVKGANLYFEASKKGKPSFSLEGVKALNDTTLQITLESPSQLFLQILCSVQTSVIAKEAFEKYGEQCVVGSGPFLYKSTEQDNKIILVKNPNYYLKDKQQRSLPYLDSIVISSNQNQLEELNLFKERQLDVVNSGLPIKVVNDFLASEIKSFQRKNAKFIMELSSNMSTQFYVFNTTKKPFNNKKFRQAISYAIDRDKIAAEVLDGQASNIGIHGIVPPSFKKYPINNVKGYDLNVDLAKKLLAEAGYPNGEGLDPIYLKLNPSSRNILVALEIQKQLKNNLNINLEFEIIPFSAKLEAQKEGKGDLFRSSWVADYPSPLSFFQMGYSKFLPVSSNEPSYPNTSRFKNEKFDKLYENAMVTMDEDRLNNLLAQADQILMDEAPIIVLWYDQNFRLIQSKVKNYFFNPINYRNCTEVYIEE